MNKWPSRIETRIQLDFTNLISIYTPIQIIWLQSNACFSKQQPGISRDSIQWAYSSYGLKMLKLSEWLWVPITRRWGTSYSYFLRWSLSSKGNIEGILTRKLLFLTDPDQFLPGEICFSGQQTYSIWNSQSIFDLSTLTVRNML